MVNLSATAWQDQFGLVDEKFWAFQRQFEGTEAFPVAYI